MARIIKLAIIALLLTVAYREGLPLLTQQLGQGAGPSGSPGSGCVAAAQQASDVFGDRVGRVSGPGTDPQVWEDFRSTADREIYEAQKQCDCSEDSCAKAREALSELSHQLSQFDDRYRSGSIAQNPAQLQIRIHRLLGEARELARQGR